MSNFPNGLDRIETSSTPGSPGADNAAVATRKINANFERTLVLGGAWLGAGLSWVNGRVVLSNPQGSLLIGSTPYQLSSEFLAANGTLSIDSLSVRKLTGQLDIRNIGLANGNILVGGSADIARALTINTDDFTFAGDRLSLRGTADGGLNAAKLSLPIGHIPVGASSGSTTVALGSMFAISNGTLQVSVPNSIGYIGLQTQVVPNPVDPKLLAATKDTNNTDVLSWQSAGDLLAGAIEARLTRDNNTKELHVNESTGDDSITNRGATEFSPFKSLNRALIEVARRSYTPTGVNPNADTIIYLSVGTLTVDNRPGSAIASIATPAELASLITNGELNYFNSPSGGAIVPRGCSIVGVDVRRSTLIPLYVPDANTVGSEATAILRLTGNALVTALGFKDRPGVLRSHHLLRAIEFVSTTDLNLYYQKVYAAFAATDGYTVNNLIANPTETQIVADIASNTVDLNGFPRANNVDGASAYIFNVSLRSRFGLSGMFLDGNVVSGTRSMVAAQFTNVSQQVDPTAYTADLTDPLEGKNYREDYRHYSFKAINGAYAQLVSCFAIGDAVHYWADSGGEISITNSCSNFGGVSLLSEGYSALSLPQDRGYGGVRLVPPKTIAREIVEVVIGSFNPIGTTDTLIVTNRTVNTGALEYVNNSYIYIRVPNRAVPGTTIDLQAKLVATGATYSATGSGVIITPTFNVVNAPGVEAENSIYLYLNCLGAYEFQSVWYDPSSPLPGGYAAALAAEIALREQLLQNSNIFCKRVLENRSVEDRNYRWIITVPATTRAPVVNYVIRQLALDTAPERFYVARVKAIDPSALVGDSACSSLPGTVTQIEILRANRTNLTGIAANYPDQLEDLNLRPDYAKTLANLDPRLYPTEADLRLASIDSSSASWLSTNTLLTNLGYPVTTIEALMAPTEEGTLPQRYRCLPTLGTTVFNSNFTFDLLTPSLIRCSGHTWEWVGYRNYSTALPELQTRVLNDLQRLAAIQSSQFGGRIYATGMDELGNLYQGRTVVSLADNSTQVVRFDGLQQSVVNVTAPEGNTFQDLQVAGILQAGTATINNLRVGLTIFDSASQFRVDTGSGFLLPTEASTPNGIKASTTLGTYGLARRAFASELSARSGEGFVSPPDLIGLDAQIMAIMTAVANLNSTPGASIVAVGNTDGGYADLAGGLRIQWGYETNRSHNEIVTFPVPFVWTWYVGTNAVGDGLRWAASANVTSTNFRLKMEVFGGSRSFNVSWFAIGKYN